MSDTTATDAMSGSGSTGGGTTRPSAKKGSFGFVLDRTLSHYPDRGPRYLYLGITVAVTVMLYYIYFVPPSVATLALPYYHMSFLYYMMLIVIGNAFAAFTAWIGGLSDRIGRANIIIYGLIVVALIQLLAIPNITTKAGFSIAYVVIGFVEGIILVATPALVRDFSPEAGRGATMGFWTLGPVLGSLIATLVAEHTLGSLHPFQDQFIISGIVSLAVAVIGFFGLRELSPGLRSQRMVSLRDRALVESRAKGIDMNKELAHPLRSMLKLDLMISSIGISTYLLIYYAAVSVLTIYLVVVFGQTTTNANGIEVWYWAFDAGALIVMGTLSDRLRVRKPFMLVGAVGSLVMLLIWLSRVHHPTTGYYTLVWLVALIAVVQATGYATWMAHYTEAVEKKNPALSATGLAVWGWILRIIVAISFLVIPHVITTASTIVDNQGPATTLAAMNAAAPYVTQGKPAPATVITQLNAAKQPYTSAMALFLANAQNVKTVTTLVALEAANPYSAAVLNSKAPAAPAQVVAALRATGEPYAIALADGESHTPIPSAIAPQIGGLIYFQGAGADVLAGQAPPASTIAKIKKASPQLVTLLTNMQHLVHTQPNVFTELTALNTFNGAASELQAGQPVSAATYAKVQAASPELGTLLNAAEKIIPAQKHSPSQWEAWWWVTFGGCALFLVLIFFLEGRWSPRAAKRDAEEYDKRLAEELAKLEGAGTST